MSSGVQVPLGAARAVKRMPCCGAPVFWFRPFQCVHDYRAWRDRTVQLELGL